MRAPPAPPHARVAASGCARPSAPLGEGHATSPAASAGGGHPRGPGGPAAARSSIGSSCSSVQRWCKRRGWRGWRRGHALVLCTAASASGRNRKTYDGAFKPREGLQSNGTLRCFLLFRRCSWLIPCASMGCSRPSRRRKKYNPPEIIISHTLAMAAACARTRLTPLPPHTSSSLAPSALVLVGLKLRAAAPKDPGNLPHSPGGPQTHAMALDPPPSQPRPQAPARPGTPSAAGQGPTEAAAHFFPRLASGLSPLPPQPRGARLPARRQPPRAAAKNPAEAD